MIALNDRREITVLAQRAFQDLTSAAAYLGSSMVLALRVIALFERFIYSILVYLIYVAL